MGYENQRGALSTKWNKTHSSEERRATVKQNRLAVQHTWMRVYRVALSLCGNRKNTTVKVNMGCGARRLQSQTGQRRCLRKQEFWCSGPVKVLALDLTDGAQRCHSAFTHVRMRENVALPTC